MKAGAERYFAVRLRGSTNQRCKCLPHLWSLALHKLGGNENCSTHEGMRTKFGLSWSNDAIRCQEHIKRRDGLLNVTLRRDNADAPWFTMGLHSDKPIIS